MGRTALTPTIPDSRGRRPSTGGFTLVELLLATMMSALVFAAIFSAYLFVARNLTRLTNTQQQLTQTRTAIFRLTRDVNEATAITTAADSSLILTVPSGTATYTYNSGTQILTRTIGGVTTTLVTNLTTFRFYYYSKGGSTALTTPVSNPNVLVGQLEMRYTSAAGSSANGTQSGFTTVSSRLVMRSKTILGQ